MRIKIYEDKKAGKKKEKVLHVSLISEYDYPRLVAVDEHGNEGTAPYILEIRPDGVFLFSNLGEGHGLPLDEEGHVKVVKE